MSLPAIRANARCSRRAQRGQSLISTIGITAVVAILVVASLTWAKTGTTQSANTARGDIATQAAEAGIQQYVSRVVESRRFWSYYVDTAEDPRISNTTGAIVPPGGTWTKELRWSYPSGSVTWKPLNSARYGDASYSLRVFDDTSLSGANKGLRIQSTAKVVPSGGNNPVVRSVEAVVRPLSLTDFQMVSNTTIVYGSAATTEGKLYSNADIVHSGTAREPLYAARRACRSGSTSCGGVSQAAMFPNKAYDAVSSPDKFSDVFPNPIDFASFSYDRVIFKQSAQTIGVYKNDPTALAWMLQFTSAGQLRVWKMTGSSSDLDNVLPSRMACPETYNLKPSDDNVLYFEQPVIIGNAVPRGDDCNTTPVNRDSVVDGRVTVATSASIYIGGNINYESPGNDVLGLMAAKNIVVGQYAPYNLTWRAATLAEDGMWRTPSPPGPVTETKGTMTFIGSTATKDGGYANMYRSRVYQYDDTFVNTGPPPQFPDVDGTWDVVRWHEVTPPG